MNTLIRRTAIVAPNVTLEYVEYGPGDGVPVVLLHGYTDSWHSWEPLLSHVPTSWRAIALSQRGHGDSSRPATGYDLNHYVADVAAFLNALTIDQAVIVGHSMGSLVAQRFAARHPERVAGLVLIGAFASLGDNVAVREFYDSTIATLTDRVEPALAREFQFSSLYRSVPSAFFDTAVRESLKLPARLWREVFEQLMAADVAGDRTRITAPTLILWGDRDGFATLEEQRALKAAIAGSRLLIYAETGHAPNWEQPVRVAKDMAAFVDENVARRAVSAA